MVRAPVFLLEIEVSTGLLKTIFACKDVTWSNTPRAVGIGAAEDVLNDA